MPVNQSDKQASLRAKTSTSGAYEGDFHAYWDLLGTVPAGPFEGRMLAWINGVLGTSYTNVNVAQQAYAVSKGAYNWDSLGNLVLP